MKINQTLAFVPFKQYSNGDGKLQVTRSIDLENTELAVSYTCLELIKKLNHELEQGDIPPQHKVFKQLIKETNKLYLNYYNK